MAPLLCGLLFVALWQSYRFFWLDDAFITFRYARNLAHGLGPVFNPGEAVEGYTSFLWLLITAVPFALFDDMHALAAIKAVELQLGLWILWRTWTFPAPRPAPGAGADSARPTRRWLVVLLAANPVFLANSGDGMETPLYTALLLECARSFTRAPTLKTGAATGALVAAAVWTRPESLALWVGLPLLLALIGPRNRFGSWLRGFGATSLPLVLGHLLWRWDYYGALLPNTFYAKATGALAPRLVSGLSDLGAFGSFHLGVPALGVWLALALACVGLARAPRPAPVEARAWRAILWGIVAFRVAFDVWSGSEWMGVFRFLSPALPALIILADDGLRHMPALQLPALQGKPGRALAVGICALTVAVGIWGHIAQTRVRAGYERGLRQAHIALGSWLAQRHAPDALIALGDAGAIPFFSGLPTLDLWGLNDATIAGLEGEYGSRPDVVEYALGREPDVFVIWSLVPILRDPQRPRIYGGQTFDRAITEHPIFQRDYRFVREFTFRPEAEPWSGYYLEVFERRTSGDSSDRGVPD